jgi:hypothetical protein
LGERIGDGLVSSLPKIGERELRWPELRGAIPDLWAASRVIDQQRQSPQAGNFAGGVDAV